ncbi:MAG: hypothetical protein ABW007_17940 [Chitinophagaceae bacterium]
MDLPVVYPIIQATPIILSFNKADTIDRLPTTRPNFTSSRNIFTFEL